MIHPPEFPTSQAAWAPDRMAPAELAPRQRGRVWARFRRRPLAVAGAVVILGLVLVALTAPLLTGVGLVEDPLRNVGHYDARPGGQFLLGTDRNGRDMLARTVYGARVSLSIGILLQVVNVAVGGTIGLVAGYLGGHADNLLMRVTDLVYAFPSLLFVLVVAAVLGPGYWHIFLAIGLVTWPYLARLVRAQVLSLKEQPYVLAARAVGTRRPKLVIRHILPHCLAAVVVTATFAIPEAIFVEAFLSFVGVGLPPLAPSWGTMLNQGFGAVLSRPHEVFIPAAAIAITTMSFALVGDGLRDALDIRMRG